MKCPECHSDNPDTQLFCGECGSQLSSPEEIPIAPTKTLRIPTKDLIKGTIFARGYEVFEELGKGKIKKWGKDEDCFHLMISNP